MKNELATIISTLKKDQIIKVYRATRKAAAGNDGLGFDPERLEVDGLTGKAALIQLLINRVTSGDFNFKKSVATQAIVFFRENPDASVEDFQAKEEEVNCPVCGYDLEEIKSCPACGYDKVKLEGEAKAATPPPVAAVENATQNLIKAVLDNAAPSIDIDNVKKIVAAEVNSRFENLELPTRTIYETKDGVKREVEGVAHSALKDVLFCLNSGADLMLSGPAGCGKTKLAEQAADALGLKFSGVSCSEGMSESNLLGRLVPINGHGFEHITTPFLDIYENGGVFLFDEMDACDANVLFSINQALANGGFYNDLRHNAPFIKRHKDTYIIATCNTLGKGGNRDYIRNKLDAATLDRFAIILMDYDAKIEAQLVDAEILAWANKLRGEMAQQGIGRFCSMRELIRLTSFKDNGATLKYCKDKFFTNWTKDEKSKLSSDVK